MELPLDLQAVRVAAVHRRSFLQGWGDLSIYEVEGGYHILSGGAELLQELHGFSEPDWPQSLDHSLFREITVTVDKVVFGVQNLPIFLLVNPFSLKPIFGILAFF